MTDVVPVAGTEAAMEPLAERSIRDAETLRALSDPIRLRILEVMTAGADEVFTVRRLAGILETSQTKLYHHINLLLERSLITVASQRVVSGIIETSYRVGQRSLRLDRDLLVADGPAMHDTLAALFDGARDDIERALRAGVASTDPDGDAATRLLLARGLARLSPERARAFRERLVALFDEFGAHDDQGEHGRPATAYGLVLGWYPSVTGDDGEADR